MPGRGGAFHRKKPPTPQWGVRQEAAELRGELGAGNRVVSPFERGLRGRVGRPSCGRTPVLHEAAPTPALPQLCSTLGASP